MEKKTGRPRTSTISVGHKFGMLTAVEDVSPPIGKQTWRLRCECGALVERKLEVLKFGEKRGFVANCGCYTKVARSRSGKLKTEHGLSVADPLLYGVHAQMLRRCYTETCKDYVHYGARGITVCDAWHDPREFFEWAASSGYRHGLTIERKDVNKGYTPDNCTWVPNEVQSHNTRRNVFVTIDGKTQHLSAWAREYGVPVPTVKSRIRNGWEPEKAVSTPSKRRVAA